MIRQSLRIGGQAAENGVFGAVFCVLPTPRSGRLSRRPEPSRGTRLPSLRAPGFSAVSPSVLSSLPTRSKKPPCSYFVHFRKPNGLSSHFGRILFKGRVRLLSVEDDSPQYLSSLGENALLRPPCHIYLSL